MSKDTNNTKTKIKRLRMALVELNKNHSWRDIAELSDYIGVPAGTLCSIANGADVPKKHRKRLGLPVYKPAPVCKCGDVHTTKRCTKNDKPRKKRDLFSYSAQELHWMLENRE